jgi:CDGSH-type Zn-finger protein
MSEERTIIEVAANGPLLVKGTVEVKHADGRVEVKEKQCALCRCGHSTNKPWCDGSHRKEGFVG